MNEFIDLESRCSAHKHHPLAVVLTRGDVHARDSAGTKCLDMLSEVPAGPVSVRLTP